MHFHIYEYICIHVCVCACACVSSQLSVYSQLSHFVFELFPSAYRRPGNKQENGNGSCSTSELANRCTHTCTHKTWNIYASTTVHTHTRTLVQMHSRANSRKVCARRKWTCHMCAFPQTLTSKSSKKENKQTKTQKYLKQISKAKITPREANGEMAVVLRCINVIKYRWCVCVSSTRATYQQNKNTNTRCMYGNVKILSLYALKRTLQWTPLLPHTDTHSNTALLHKHWQMATLLRVCATYAHRCYCN